MKNRIIEEKIEIDYKNTQEFFENRGKNGKQLQNKYNYVLFQDNSPELALERDRMEKEKIGAYLFAEKPNGQRKTVLDIGCGVGRWGEELLNHNYYYIGIDYSQNLLTIAAENLSKHSSCFQLIHGAAQNLSALLKQEQLCHPFDLILINGVCMYLNDSDLSTVLETVQTLIGTETILYLKETVSKEKRLTLNQFYSKELTQDYTAIYRYEKEYAFLLERNFISNHIMEWIASGELFENELKNRKETVDYFYLLKSIQSSNERK